MTAIFPFLLSDAVFSASLSPIALDESCFRACSDLVVCMILQQETVLLLKDRLAADDDEGPVSCSM